MAARNETLLPRRLLVVQHKLLVGRALARFFAPFFGEVEVAARPADAEALLVAHPALLTDIVCGVDFGPGEPAGTSWIPRFRRHACVGSIVVASARTVTDACGADLVVEKPVDPTLILDFLSGAAGEPERVSA
jgi:hypothetical protein